MATTSEPAGQRTSIPFYRDERILHWLWQLAFAAFVIGIGYLLLRNMTINLNKLGLTPGFSFLRATSGFDLSEVLLPYSRGSTYLRALQVGLLNTLLVSVLGIVFATLLGIIVGVARLSENFLINRLARIYVEILRNLPLLVLLVFWYTAVFIRLPRVQQAIVLPGPVYLSNRGVAIPWGLPTATFQTYRLIVLGGLALAIAVGALLAARGRRTGRMPLVWLWGLLVWVIVAWVGWFLLPQKPLTADLPFVKGLNLSGGRTLSPEFMALLSGLAIYTSAFIADIVRAGLQAVSRGQVEASRALGLSTLQTLRMVVFPQAMRLMIPPLTSQYLNLTKNSSLAIAIAYPDLFYVSNTIINNTGRSVEMISLVMLIYLSISILTSVFMNWYNNKISLRER